MNKIWLVLKNEFINTVSRRSFLLTLILVPLVPALIFGGISLLGKDTVEDVTQMFQTSQVDQQSEGYVDPARIIQKLPEWVEAERLIPFESEAAAREATLAGEINGFYLIDPDFLETGAIKYVLSDFNFSAIETTGFFTTVIEFNLLDGDTQRYQIYQNPVQVERVNLSPEETERDQSNLLAFYIPYGVTMLFYVVIVTSASLMLNSVAKEKENRIMEILMSSVKPTQLLTGKIIGLGLVGLLQMVVWMGSAMLMLRLSGTTFNIPPNLQPSPELLFWGIAFFILGFLLYATIMAGVGALVPNIKEASQATFIIILPLLVPLMMIGAIINQPDTGIAVALSLIPFTAPNTIMTRMAVSPVPLWQLLTAIVLMLLTIFLLIRAVAGMFRAQHLLTGKKFSLGLLVKALLGKDLEQPELIEG